MSNFDINLYPVILNSSNVVAGTNNSKYRYFFPQGSVKFKGSKVALSSLSIYYSWFNITAAQGNNVFQYVWYNNAGSTTHTITIPDGFYDITGLNAYLQSQMITNGNYLLNASGNYIYYLEFAANSTYYSIQFNSYAIPTALPAGWSNPASITFPATATTPQLIIENNAFQQVIGFAAGTYPAATQSTTYSVLSTSTPEITPTESVIVLCNLLNNKYSVPSTVLYSFSPAGTTFGAVIQSSPTFYSFIDVQDGNYVSFDITLVDQNFNALNIQDNNLVISLLIGRHNDTLHH